MAAKEILTPVGGRFVHGSLYVPQTKNMDGKPFVFKDGTPRNRFYVALAIKKGKETSWAQTDWGQIIYLAGQELCPTQYTSPTFAWKIRDGDDDRVSTKGKKQSDYVGNAGCWILHCENIDPPNIYNKDGTQPIVEKDAVKPGYYIQICGTIRGNGSVSNPGIFLNPRLVAFTAYGEEIVFSQDAATVGFGAGELPQGASETPIGKGLSITPHTAILNPPTSITNVPVPSAPRPPAPPAPPVTQKQSEFAMTPLAQGFSREQYHAMNWTDEQLIANNMMLPVL